MIFNHIKELKEQGKASQITLIHVGTADADATLRKGIALGADDAVRIDINAADTFEVAFQIAQFAKTQSYELILTGKETIDYNSACIGSIVAALLDLPFVSSADAMDLNGTTATIKREIEGGEETCEVNTPFIASCQKGMAEQRIPNMRGIMAARTKPLQVVAPSASTARTTIQSFALPQAKSGVKLVDAGNMDELVRLLKEEAKVI